MRKRFILYKVTTVPAGGETVNYLREIRLGKAFFTTVKREAARYSIVRAFYQSVKHSLAILPERLL